MKTINMKGILGGLLIAVACLPAMAAQPAKVKVTTHYLVPVRSGPSAARPGHSGKPLEMTEIKTTTRPVVRRTHHRIVHRDRFSTMRETIREAARKQ